LVTAREISSLDSALIEAGYLGDVDALQQLVDAWKGAKAGRAYEAGAMLLEAVRELLPLRSTAPPARHLEVLLAFLTAHEQVPGPDDPLRVRQLRTRSAILGTLTSLLSAYGRFDSHQVAFDEVAALVRRSIESQTFAPRTGDSGVHLVDVASAKFGEFDAIYLAGLVEGEWPDRPRRNIFYSPALLRELGWPAESERLASARSTFRDLLCLPTARVIVSTFTLEQDSVVVPSTFLDELERSGLDIREEARDATRVFEYEALGLEPVEPYGLIAAARTWAERRLAKIPQDDRRFRGATSGYNSSSWSLSAIERYQDCPFKFFAADVLRLEEIRDDDTFSPRARGRFIHEVFQRFFEEWDRRGDRTITSDRVDEARTLFQELAEPLLARLSETDAALERSRLFGSAVTVGIVDVVLGLEASRAASVRERWLEHRFHGEFTLGTADGRRVSLNGVADRVDLLEGRQLRVIDYKSGYPPPPQRALQVPIYALCAQEELLARDGHLWQVQEAAYVAFSGKRALVPVVRRDDDDGESILSAARKRLLAAIDGIERGEFPPRPHDPAICNYCSFASVCRKDYVGDDAPQ
jgi:ATP-dependent helicase/nuclease subunit B